MRLIGAAEMDACLTWRSLTESLRQAYRRGTAAPPRTDYDIPAELPDGRLAMATAWEDRRHIGVRIATFFPGNPELDKPVGMGVFLLLSAKTGQPLALLDGQHLTRRCAAALSALASSYLSRNDASRLLMIGTGALSAGLVLAHAEVRPIKEVIVWGRNARKAAKLAKTLSNRDFTISATDDLQTAVAGAHIICCATAAAEPLLQGRWLTPGVHIDLVGSMTPDGRESDDTVVETARLFVDTRDGAVLTGDFAQPMADGKIADDDIAGDMFQLTQGAIAGRRFYDQITLFKSCGNALTDLAGAQIAFRQT